MDPASAFPRRGGFRASEVAQQTKIRGQCVIVGDAHRAARTDGGVIGAEANHRDATETAHGITTDASTESAAHNFEQRKFVA